MNCLVDCLVDSANRCARTFCFAAAIPPSAASLPFMPDDQLTSAHVSHQVLTVRFFLPGFGHLQFTQVACPLLLYICLLALRGDAE